MWQCSACRHQCSLRAGTVFNNTKLPLTTWFLALYLLSQSKTNLSALELMRHLGVCYRTAWRLKHKLMQAMTEREAGRRLGGLVQVDDAYLGGERNGGKSGRGSENKRPLVIGVSTNEAGHPRYAVITPVSGFTKVALTDWAQRHLQPEIDVFSDGLGAFRAVVDLGHAHTVIETAGGRAATEATHARWVNIVLCNLKRSLDGAYHSFGFFKYAHRYLAAAAWRFNRRFELDALCTDAAPAGGGRTRYRMVGTQAARRSCLCWLTLGANQVNSSHFLPAAFQFSAPQELASSVQGRADEPTMTCWRCMLVGFARGASPRTSAIDRRKRAISSSQWRAPFAAAAGRCSGRASSMRATGASARLRFHQVAQTREQQCLAQGMR